MNIKSIAPSNEALMKSGNKPSFVVPYRIIIHPFRTSFLKENNLAVVLNAITTSLVRLLENRFEPKMAYKKSIRKALFAALEGEEDYIEALNLLSKIN